MAVSLPAIVLGNSESGSTPGLSVEATLNQGVGDQAQDFGAIIGELSPELAEVVSTLPEDWPELDEFIQQLQDLPQEGNSLPLLAQFIGAAESSGKSPLDVLERLEEQLELLPSDQNVATIAAAITSLRTIIKIESPLQASVAVTVQAPARVDARTEPARTIVPSSNERTIAFASADERRVDTSAHTILEKVGQTTDQKTSALEPVVFQLSKANGNTMRTPEFSTMISALRRVTSTAQFPSIAELHPRADSLGSTSIAALSAPISVQGSPAGTPNMLHIPVSVQDPGWAQSVGERVQWMVGQQVQSAQIRLNPDHLGPMAIKLNIQNEQASIQINSAHAIVREVLEAAIPRLRELMESSGIDLVDVNISDQQNKNQQAEADPDAIYNTTDAEIEDHDVTHFSETAISTATSPGFLDVFV